MFLQETHSASNDEQKWKDDFWSPLFFFHGKSNSCGVAIDYCGTEAFKAVKMRQKWANSNSQCRIKWYFLLINFYNSNTESEQLSTFSTLQKLLEKVDDYNKKILFLEMIFVQFLIVSLKRLE